MPLVGRSQLIQEIDTHASGVTLLTGDSGVGKSSVLGELPNSDNGSITSPPPLRAQPYDGSLQTTILDQIALACALAERAESRSQRIGKAFDRAVNKMVNASSREIAKIAVDQIFGILASRIGQEGASVIKAAVTSLTTSENASLIDRVNKTADLDVIKTLIAIATEAAAVVGNLRLRIDSIERLTDPDFQLLTALPDLVPDQISIVAAYAVTNQTHVERVRLARQRGVVEVPVPPLVAADVQEWLTNEDIDLTHLDQVYRLSNGYPLVVDAATKQLRDGQSLVNLPAHDAFEAMTESAWLSLETRTRTYARSLVPFSDPPDAGRIAALLGLSVHEWFSIQEELVESRIFSVTVGNSPWFHERRRNALWSRIITLQEKRQMADTLTSKLVEWVNEPGPYDSRLALTLADLAPLSSALRSATPTIGAVLDLSRLELAQMYAALELVDSNDEQPAFVDTSTFVEYARQVLHVTGDAVGAVQRLNAVGLLYSATNDERSISTFVVSDRITMAVLVGRCTREFGRLPLGRAATSVFEMSVRPRMESFLQAHYGIGHPHFGSEYKKLVSARSRQQHLPAVCLRGKYGVRPFYLTATFGTDDERDQAHTELSNVNEWVLGERFFLTQVHKLPCDRVPSLRFIRAIEQVTSRDLRSLIRPGIVPKGNAGLTVEDLATQRVRAVRYMRDRLDSIGRCAFWLDRITRTVIAGMNDGYTIVDIESDHDGAAVIDRVVSNTWRDPFGFVRLADELEIGQNERITHVDYKYGEDARLDDPVLRAFHLARRYCVSFNATQPVFVLPGLQNSLESLLYQGLLSRHEDVMAITNSDLQISEPRPYQPRTYYIIVYRDGVPSHTRPLASYVWAKSATPNLHLVESSETPDFSQSLVRFTKKFNFDEDDIEGGGNAALDFLAADFLGYEQRDVRTW